MNRHHPYGGYENHRGGSQGGPGPDRSHRGGGGGNRGRGYARGRGGGGGAANAGGYYASSTASGGYDGNMSYGAYDQAPDQIAPYNGNDQQTPTSYFNNNGYGSPSSSQYGGGYNQGYGKFEDGSGPGEDNFGRVKKQGRKDREDKVHDSIIEERINRERPCRTLFIRNIKYETNSSDVRHQFEEHGDIKTFFDLISTRGMVFVTYFDLRAAERARERLQGSEISGRPIDVHYSLPRDDRDNDKNMQLQGCLQVTLKNSPSGQPIDDNEVRRKFQQFGDVKSIQPVGDRMDSRYVEYYDTRACDDAHDRLRHQGLQDGVMDIAFAWDPNEGGAQGSQSSRRGNRGGGGAEVETAITTTGTMAEEEDVLGVDEVAAESRPGTTRPRTV
ncbi:RNA-binding domain-containing protein [Gymnopus androsaceus JB14]|uniref:RNA-binding domain-containing protein n=1 Tax=Gymnopus androsaceus JB14 TaxID=1447944 RepID=A0A6A4IGX9_9AGAR|nr:RNA-binding domain-containing protein [Gymnopus androsaceus JB14]